MKTNHSLRGGPSSLSSCPLSRSLAGLFASTALAPFTLPAVDNLWTGVVNNDWNNPGNWSDPHGFGSLHVPTNEAGHPADEDAAINTITPNIATITADLVATPRDIKVVPVQDERHSIESVDASEKPPLAFEPDVRQG